DSRVRGDQLLRPPRSTSLEEGERIHRALESIEWWDDLVGVPPELGDCSIERLEEWLSRRGFARRLRTASGAAFEDCTVEVSNEAPFALGDAERLLSGTIDRLVLAARDGRVIYAEVIDYKSDRWSSQRDQERATERYTSQLAAYEGAVRRLYRPTVSTSHLLFVRPETPEFAPPSSGRSGERVARPEPTGQLELFGDDETL
ncbi:MAG: PD-(D/E)XK nuclease family protein, partial [Planctomycetes bacterium]|nr:PD-(D/E)XK nuclease family protein [Planctomycetota bacterium]